MCIRDRNRTDAYAAISLDQQQEWNTGYRERARKEKDLWMS